MTNKNGLKSEIKILVNPNPNPVSGSESDLMSRFLITKEDETNNNSVLCLEMSEVERKFIMMARIGNLLTRNGLIVSVTSFGSFCSISVQDGESHRVLEDKTSNQLTEQELLDWWSAIENDVE